MRLRHAAFVSLGVVAFVACGDDYTASPNTTTDGGTGADAASSTSSGSSGRPNVDSGSGPFKEEENLPCEGRTAEDRFSIFVTTTGTDSPSCGTREAPCKTVMAGFASALAAQKPKVLLGPGIYNEVLELNGGFTFEGGWDVSGTTWTARCGAGHSGLTTIQTPDSSNVSVRATKGATVLRFLTIKSKPTAAPGESLIGLIAIGPDVKVAIDDTSFIVAGGGKGTDGATATGTVDSACGGDHDGANGLNGAAGAVSSIGSLSSTGFTSGIGGDGMPGTNGHQGTAAPVPSTFAYDKCVVSGASCTSVSQQVVPNQGLSGCGGGGGKGGKAGTGGGSSVGILASDALIVTYGGSVTTGAGGEGGNGGGGADGADGTPGKTGVDSVYLKAPSGGCGSPPDCGNISTALPGGAGGGPGGKGGKGGQGSGGAGGWSISFAKFGTAALLQSTTTLFTTTVGGKGGAPNGPDGLRQQQWP